MDPLNFLLNIGKFHCYVSLTKGNKHHPTSQLPLASLELCRFLYLYKSQILYDYTYLPSATKNQADPVSSNFQLIQLIQCPEANVFSNSFVSKMVQIYTCPTICESKNHSETNMNQTFQNSNQTRKGK